MIQKREKHVNERWRTPGAQCFGEENGGLEEMIGGGRREGIFVQGAWRMGRAKSLWKRGKRWKAKMGGGERG